MTNAARPLPQRRGRAPLVLRLRLAAPFADPQVVSPIAADDRPIVADRHVAAAGHG